MVSQNEHSKKGFWALPEFCLVVLLVVFLLQPFVPALAENNSVQHYKMFSTVEYSGKQKFKSQVETLVTTRKEYLSDQKVRYHLSARDFDLITGSSTPGQVSFVVDRSNGQLSEGGKDLALLKEINNRCVNSLEPVTEAKIGKTWKQSFNLSFLDHLLADELKFTLTAMQIETEDGGMIAVRALSEPFIIKATDTTGKIQQLKARINSAYLFDSQIEDIYISVSVFEASGKIDGVKGTLRHEVATYKADAEGVCVSLEKLNKKFAKFLQKVGLEKKSLEVKTQGTLPRWAQSEALVAAQVANICAAMACEGASNPVALVFIPAAKAVSLQTLGTITSIGPIAAAAGSLGTVGGALGASVPAFGTMQIAAAPFMGVGLGTAGAIAGGTTAAVAAGSSSSSSSSRSP